MTETQLGFDAEVRNAILDRVLEHAGDEWQAAAVKGIASLAGTGEVFQAHDLVRLGVPEPNHSARWGAVFTHAAKVGLIERVGYAPSARPATRGSAAATWRGAGVTPAPDGPPVKAISLSRPWAGLAATGHKVVENRTWTHPHRGLLVIHAAKSWDNAAQALADAGHVAWTPALADIGARFGYIGVVELVDVCNADRIHPGSCLCWDDPEVAPWAMAGMYHWRLINAAPLALPIPGRGRLGLWTPPLDVIQAARRAATSDRKVRTA